MCYIIFDSFQISTDEFETLCDRVAIQNNGDFICIGSNAELKTLCSSGVILNVCIRRDALREHVLQVKSRIMGSFQQVQLRDEFEVKNTHFIFKNIIYVLKLSNSFQNQLEYVIREDKLVWSNIFRKILQIQADFGNIMLSLYAFESSLEDTFLEIATELQKIEK